MRVLIIEDDPAICANVRDYLEACGHSVEAARDGALGFQLAANRSFDVILLDLGLPKMDGMALSRRLREEVRSETPILMLTARDTLQDKIAGFEHGADDYVVKPFALEEVAARIGALHNRRTGKLLNGVVRVGELVHDPTTQSVRFRGVAVKLAPKCMQLLAMLMAHPGRLFSRNDIELALWGGCLESSDRVRYHVHLLRQALTNAGGRDPIKTVHGKGFVLLREQ